jgi:hypothetical protein
MSCARVGWCCTVVILANPHRNERPFGPFGSRRLLKRLRPPGVDNEQSRHLARGLIHMTKTVIARGESDKRGVAAWTDRLIWKHSCKVIYRCVATQKVQNIICFLKLESTEISPFSEGQDMRGPPCHTCATNNWMVAWRMRRRRYLPSVIGSLLAGCE